MLNKKDITTFIIVVKKEDNVLANNSLKNRTAFLFKQGDRNIYLLQKDRLEEFMNEGYYENLSYHYTIHSKKELINRK